MTVDNITRIAKPENKIANKPINFKISSNDLAQIESVLRNLTGQYKPSKSGLAKTALLGLYLPLVKAGKTDWNVSNLNEIIKSLPSIRN